MNSVDIPIALDVLGLALTFTIAFIGAKWMGSKPVTGASSRRFNDSRRSLLPLIKLLPVVLLLAFVWNPGISVRFSEGYVGDSFLTLTVFGRLGLGVISALLILLLVIGAWVKAQWLSRGAYAAGSTLTKRSVVIGVDLLSTVLIFWLALVLVTQI